MTHEVYTVKYGRDGSCHRYVHSHELGLENARKACDDWRTGGGWGGDPESLRVWVEDRTGIVVYGEEAKP